MNEPLSILVCLPPGSPLADPDPDQTAARDVRVVSSREEDTRGVVGWSLGGWDALAVAARCPEIPRLVIASLPFPDTEPEGVDLDTVLAKTLLLYGTNNPETGSKHGTRWQKRLPDARLEMVPGAGHDLLGRMWHRVLSHLAPRRKAT